MKAAHVFWRLVHAARCSVPCFVCGYAIKIIKAKPARLSGWSAQLSVAPLFLACKHQCLFTTALVWPPSILPTPVRCGSLHPPLYLVLPAALTLCCILLAEKLQSNVPGRYFERNLRTWRRVLAGPHPGYECLLPPSLYLLRKMVGREWEAFEFHVCPCDGYRWVRNRAMCGWVVGRGGLAGGKAMFREEE